MLHKRYRELDALRGLAATSVVAFHYLISFDAFGTTLPAGQQHGWPARINFSIFHLFFAGSEAVLFFFVLSGFVLYLAVDGFSARQWGAFATQRMCRIYLPFLAAVALGMALNSWLHLAAVPGLNCDHFNIQWSRAPNWRDIIEHVLFVFGYDETVSDAPTWSLLHEIRFSLLFPAIVLFVSRTRPAIAILSSLAISIVAGGLSKFTHFNVFATLLYTDGFVLGAVMARYHDVVVQYFAVQRPWWKVGALALAILLYTYSWWFLPDVKNLHRVPFNNLLVTIGAAIFMVLSMGSTTISRLLQGPVPQLLGRLSYSIYLYHFIVILLVLHLVYRPQQPFWVSPLLVVSGTLICAAISRVLIERPAIILGKWLSARPLETFRRT